MYCTCVLLVIEGLPQTTQNRKYCSTVRIILYTPTYARREFPPQASRRIRTHPEAAIALAILLTLDINGIFRHAIAILQLLLDDLQTLRVLLPGEGREDTPVLALSHDPTLLVLGRAIRGGNFIAASGRMHTR